MKISTLRRLIKEVVVHTMINELMGDKPEMGQNYFDVTITYINIGQWGDGKPQTTKWPKILAKDEAEAKQKATGALNLKVVKIQSIQAQQIGGVQQQDIDQYDKDSNAYADIMNRDAKRGWSTD